MKDPFDRWQCMICDDRDYEVLPRAIIHEGSQMHIHKIRWLDRAHRMSSPPLLDEDPGGTEKRVPDAHTEHKRVSAWRGEPGGVALQGLHGV